jgi:hypothetical protein
LSRTKVRIIQRAKREGWPYRSYTARGGKERRYHLKNLPEDIQTACAESLAVSLTELQSALKPASIPEKKVVLANYNGHSVGGGGEPPPLEPDDYMRKPAAWESSLVE